MGEYETDAATVVRSGGPTALVATRCPVRHCSGSGGLLQSTSGLFNFKAASEFASRDIFYRAWGVSYPAGQSNAATVVLFSDKSLGKNGSWQTPYETHAAFLRSLLALQPAAVMIDIGFIDERKDETINNFVDALKSYHQRGIPVFLAGASRNSGAMRPVRAELQALAADKIVQLVSIETGHELGRLSMYPVVETRDGTPPASVAVRKTLCEKGVLKNCEPLKDLKEFEIWWGAKPNPLNCTNATPTDDPCAAISPGPGRHFDKLDVELVRWRVRRLGERVNPIPSHCLTRLRHLGILSYRVKSMGRSAHKSKIPSSFMVSI